MVENVACLRRGHGFGKQEFEHQLIYSVSIYFLFNMFEIKQYDIIHDMWRHILFNFITCHFHILLLMFVYFF